MPKSTQSRSQNRKSARGWIPLCLLICLSGCATPPAPVARVDKSYREIPPASLLLRPSIPEWPETLTNGELLSLARRYRTLALECNADKAAIDKWSTETAKP